MLRSNLRTRTRRWRGVQVVAVVSAMMVTAMAPPDTGPPVPQLGVVAAGACTFVGTLNVQYSRPVSLAPATVTATISGGGSCVGTGGSSVNLPVAGNVLLSCAGGDGPVSGLVSFGGSVLPAINTTGVYVGAPGSATLVLLGAGLPAGTEFVAVANLVWSPTATAACPLSGTTSTPLTGTMAYIYA